MNGKSIKKAGSLLESDYISQLNKEKEEMNAEITRDANKQWNNISHTII